jgi:hypothetical protein
VTRDDIIRVAREFGWAQKDIDSLLYIVETAAAAEREACAKVCDDQANRCEKAAQSAIEDGEHDEVSAIRSTAWKLSVCAAAIRARGQS